jgi:hypothetical protein
VHQPTSTAWCFTRLLMVSQRLVELQPLSISQQACPSEEYQWRNQNITSRLGSDSSDRGDHFGNCDLVRIGRDIL